MDLLKDMGFPKYHEGFLPSGRDGSPPSGAMSFKIVQGTHFPVQSVGLSPPLEYRVPKYHRRYLPLLGVGGAGTHFPGHGVPKLIWGPFSPACGGVATSPDHRVLSVAPGLHPQHWGWGCFTTSLGIYSKVAQGGSLPSTKGEAATSHPQCLVPKIDRGYPSQCRIVGGSSPGPRIPKVDQGLSS